MCSLSAYSNCCTACLQVVLSSEATAHAAAARAAVHEVVVKGEKAAAEAAALPQLEQMRSSAAGLTSRLSPSCASAGVQEPAYAPAAGTAAAETQGLAVVDLPVLPEGTRGQPLGAVDLLWDTEPAAEQGAVAGTVSGQQPSSPLLHQPHSQAQQGPGSAPVLLAASTAGRAIKPADAQSAEPEHMPAATNAAAHSPLATGSMPEPLAGAIAHTETPTVLSTAAQLQVGLQPHEGAATSAAGGGSAQGWPQATPSANPAAAASLLALSSNNELMVETPQPLADTGGRAAASGRDDWGEGASAGAEAPEPASGSSHKPAAAGGGGTSPVPEALPSAASVPEPGASHIVGAAGASDPQAAVPEPGRAAKAGLRHHAYASVGSKGPASSEHSWGADTLPADAFSEDQVQGVVGSLSNAEVGPAHAEAAAEPLAAMWNSLRAPDRAGSSRAAANQAAQLADEWGEDAIVAAKAPVGAAGPSAAAGHAEAAAEPSALATESLLVPQAAGGSLTAAQGSLAVRDDSFEGGTDAGAAAEAPDNSAQSGVSPAAADNLTAQQAASSGEGTEPSEGSGALAPGAAASSGFKSLHEGDIDSAAAADGAAEHEDVPAGQAAEDDWAEDDFVAGGLLPEHDQAAAELLPGRRTPGEAAPAAGSTAQSPYGVAVSEIEPAEAEEQDDWGDDDGFGDFNDAADASALEQEAGETHARPPLQHSLVPCKRFVWQSACLALNLQSPGMAFTSCRLTCAHLGRLTDAQRGHHASCLGDVL